MVLDLVRRTIQQQKVNFSRSLLEYLGRFGDWSDKDNILIFNKRFTSVSTLYGLSAPTRSKIVAATIYSLGKSRLADLINLDIDVVIKQELLVNMSQKDICSFSDDVILEQLRFKNDLYRKTFALRCVQAMSRKRIRNLLDMYIESIEQYFYNSVYWLDLGASMPRKLVQTVTRFELAALA